MVAVYHVSKEAMNPRPNRMCGKRKNQMCNKVNGGNYHEYYRNYHSRRRVVSSVWRGWRLLLE